MSKFFIGESDKRVQVHLTFLISRIVLNNKFIVFHRESEPPGTLRLISYFFKEKRVILVYRLTFHHCMWSSPTLQKSNFELQTIFTKKMFNLTLYYQTRRIRLLCLENGSYI